MIDAVLHNDEPLVVSEVEELGEVVRLMGHAAAEGLGVQVWSFERAGTAQRQAWTVELYEESPLLP